MSYVDREVVALNLGRAEIARARRLGYRVRTVRGRGAQAVQRIVPPRRVSPSAARNFLQRQFPGATVDLNHLYRLQAKGCEGEGCKWQMTLTDWSDHKQVCRPTVPIGLLDTGVDLAAIERQGHRIESARVATTGFSSASRNHGTAVTALLLGGRAQQNLALLSNAELYVADVFFEDDRGEAVTDTASLLRGLAWLRERGVKVANLSLAGPANALLEETIRSYSAEGMLFVAAAGNYGPTAPPSYPAAYNGVIAVTAVDQWEKAYSRANQGTYIRFAAPGVGLRLPTTSTRTSLQSGTSFAAPFVTAALAVMHPRTGDAALAAKLADQIQTKDLGAPGVDTVFGRGLVLAPATCAGGTMKDRAQAN